MFENHLTRPPPRFKFLIHVVTFNGGEHVASAAPGVRRVRVSACTSDTLKEQEPEI